MRCHNSDATTWKLPVVILENDVTSGLNLFHKARKWRLDFIYSRFPCICKPSVSFHFKRRMERCYKHISSTFLAYISGKENSLVLFWRIITESLLSSNGGFYTFARRVLFRLLVLVFRDSVIMLSAIAYNVNNNLDEVLLAIVCTVYPGNIITKSRFALFWKSLSPELLYPASSWFLVALCSIVLVQRQAGSQVEGSWRSVSRTPASLV